MLILIFVVLLQSRKFESSLPVIVLLAEGLSGSSRISWRTVMANEEQEMMESSDEEAQPGGAMTF
jgi:hypothetical protein